MQRYYFHLTHESKLRDDVGETLATIDDAKAHARIVASEMGAHQTEEHNNNRWITVTDEQDNEVYRISLGGGDGC
jgi:ribosomal protein S11